MLEHGFRGDTCFAEGIVTLIVYHLVFMVTQAGRWSKSRCKTNPVRVERETYIVPSAKGGIHPRSHAQNSLLPRENSLQQKNPLLR